MRGSTCRRSSCGNPGGRALGRCRRCSRGPGFVEALLRLPPLTAAANTVEARPRIPPEDSPSRSPPDAPSRTILEQQAAAARDREGYVAGEEALRELARVDWRRAEPLLNRFAAERGPRRAALALALLYQHQLTTNGAAVEVLRLRLVEIATDRRAPGAARATAFEALLTSEWPGRDDWCLARFADPTLRDMADHTLVTNPLVTPVARAPDTGSLAS